MMDCRVKPGNDICSQKQLLDLAACFLREVCSLRSALQKEGAGKAGRTMHPQSRVQIK
jgi:hypothetical protein